MIVTASKHTKQGHVSKFCGEAALNRVFKKGLLRGSRPGLTLCEDGGKGEAEALRGDWIWLIARSLEWVGCQVQ